MSDAKKSFFVCQIITVAKILFHQLGKIERKLKSYAIKKGRAENWRHRRKRGNIK